MSALANSSTARLALYNNADVTESILRGSATALSVLKSSSQYVETSGQGNTSSKYTHYSGKAFILEWKSAKTSSNTSYYSNIVTFKLSPTSIRRTCLVDFIQVGRFASEVVTYGEYSSVSDNVNGASVRYFKI